MTKNCIQNLICNVWKLPLMCPQHTNCSCCAAFFISMLLKQIWLVDCLLRWFQMGTNPHTGAEDWLYTGGYFDRNFTDCPNIYWHRRCLVFKTKNKQKKIFSLLGFILFLCESWQPDARWYCVFVRIDESWFQTGYQIISSWLWHLSAGDV